jgi:hypothetical protein
LAVRGYLRGDVAAPEDVTDFGAPAVASGWIYCGDYFLVRGNLVDIVVDKVYYLVLLVHDLMDMVEAVVLLVFDCAL